MLVSSDLICIFTIVAERKPMLAKFFIQGEGNFGGELEEIAGKQVANGQENRLPPPVSRS
jgi:hypothetical protein